MSKLAPCNERVVKQLLCKSKEDSKLFGIKEVDLTQIIDELINWRKQVSRENDEWCDPVRLAMIDSFEDIVMNAVVEE